MDEMENIEINIEEIAKEKTEGKKKIAARVKKIKEANIGETVWYEKMLNGNIKKYVRKPNGTKYSYVIGNVKKNPNLLKLLKDK